MPINWPITCANSALSVRRWLVSISNARPTMIVALLATLKAGGTYVPLNPEYPRQRLAMMIDDSAMPFLVTQQSLLETIAGHTGSSCLC